MAGGSGSLEVVLNALPFLILTIRFYQVRVESPEHAEDMVQITEKCFEVDTNRRQIRSTRSNLDFCGWIPKAPSIRVNSVEFCYEVPHKIKAETLSPQ